MRSLRLPPAAALAVALALALAGSAHAYNIVLKDGSTLLAKSYKIENGRAIITMQNGTQTFIDASQIDVARTEAANKEHLGSATLLNPATTRDLPTGDAPVAKQKQKSLTELATARGATSRDLPAARRKREEAAPGQPVRSKAGFVDLSTLPRTPYARVEIATELQQFFRGQGIQEVEIFSGTQADRPRVEFTTNSEATVLQTLQASANALLRVRERFPQKVGALELVMKTPTREKAGQFVLSPEQATDLVAKKVDVTAFFVQNVQF